MKGNQSCTILIKQLGSRVDKVFNRELSANLDITTSQSRALVEIYHTSDGQMPLKQLEKRLGLAQSVTAGIVTRLEQKNLLENLSDKKDKRIKIVKISELGKTMAEEAMKNIVEMEQKVFADFSEKEQETLYSLLLRVNEKLK